MNFDDIFKALDSNMINPKIELDEKMINPKIELNKPSKVSDFSEKKQVQEAKVQTKPEKKQVQETKVQAKQTLSFIFSGISFCLFLITIFFVSTWDCEPSNQSQCKNVETIAK